MGRENGGNGGRAQMNFINATMDMFASMYEIEGLPRLPGGLVWSTLYLLFQKHEVSPLSHIFPLTYMLFINKRRAYQRSALLSGMVYFSLAWDGNRCAYLVDKTYTASSTLAR